MLIALWEVQKVLATVSLEGKNKHSIGGRIILITFSGLLRKENWGQPLFSMLQIIGLLPGKSKVTLLRTTHITMVPSVGSPHLY